MFDEKNFRSRNAWAGAVGEVNRLEPNKGEPWPPAMFSLFRNLDTSPQLVALLAERIKKTG